MTFPNDFIWGSATSSYQIEGAALEDGRGECIWTRFSHTPGKTSDGGTGDVACDHYHRYQGDVNMMQDMGLHAYRFSTSWPRVLPQGTGSVNEAGLAFYDRLVDALLAANIEPYLTLYHWDLPQVLQDQGGWENPDSVQWFAEYTDLMTRRLGDRVKQWITLNEPWVFAFVGYAFGAHAPGMTDFPAAYRAAHHALIAHGEAVPIIRKNVPEAQVGIVLAHPYFQPATDSEEDRAAAQRQFNFHPGWFLEPLYNGRYPTEFAQYVHADQVEGITLDDVKAAAVPTDFLGLNYYSRFIIKRDPDAEGLEAARIPVPDAEHTTMDWEVYPDGLLNVLTRVHEDYGPKAIYITENGAAFNDPAPQDGVVDDPRRLAYLREHFRRAETAIAQGVPLKGYFVWSLMDNFEWGHGYEQRFGIVHVDYQTQQRTLKNSARWYKQVIAANAIVDQ